jgi:phosphoribosylamine--glycine ligase
VSALPRSVLVVGGGGREHALVRALALSPSCPRVICSPGNAGIALDAKCFAVPVDNVPGMVALASQEKIELVVVGPEVPLALGLADALEAANIAVFGPTADGARLEASKIYTKEILVKYGIPTAASAAFSEAAPALDWMAERPVPIVIKADGLAAGKGVIVATHRQEAEAAVRDLLPGRVLIEECLVGQEASILVVVSGRDYVILPPAQDHKRIGDGDTGPNTGGMGAVSPAAIVTAAALTRIEREIVQPSVAAIAEEGIAFRGVLFIGIMLTATGPRVLEYNTRFGDPETQAVLPRLESDLLEILWLAASGRLGGYVVKVKPQPAVCVVVASKGYPGDYAKGEPIRLPPASALAPHTTILHAGTALDANGQWVNNGGRVLSVVSTGRTIYQAIRQAYDAVDLIEWRNGYVRRDIGAKQL